MHFWACVVTSVLLCSHLMVKSLKLHRIKKSIFCYLIHSTYKQIHTAQSHFHEIYWAISNCWWNSPTFENLFGILLTCHQHFHLSQKVIWRQSTQNSQWLQIKRFFFITLASNGAPQSKTVMHLLTDFGWQTPVVSLTSTSQMFMDWVTSSPHWPVLITLSRSPRRNDSCNHLSLSDNASFSSYTEHKECLGGKPATCMMANVSQVLLFPTLSAHIRKDGDLGLSEDVFCNSMTGHNSPLWQLGVMTILHQAVLCNSAVLLDLQPTCSGNTTLNHSAFISLVQLNKSCTTQCSDHKKHYISCCNSIPGNPKDSKFLWMFTTYYCS